MMNSLEDEAVLCLVSFCNEVKSATTMKMSLSDVLKVFKDEDCELLLTGWLLAKGLDGGATLRLVRSAKKALL